MISKVSLRIKGRKIRRFIKRLSAKKIEVLSLKYISDNEIIIVIYKKDYDAIMKIKSIYDIELNDVYGSLKVKKIFKLNKHLIISFVFCFSLFLFLTNVIFKVEIIHSNKQLRLLLKEELANNGIKKFSLKKTYNDIAKIKEKILNAYPDEIEWLEIQTVGTKYVVRVEEREVVSDNKDSSPRDLVAKKTAVIKKITSSKGDVIKSVDDYVQKGDVIVSGNINLNEKSMGKVRTAGKVYGEVWYVVHSKYPFVYYESKETGKTKDVYVLKFLNHEFEFTFSKFKHKKTDEKIIFKHNSLPIQLVIAHQKEVKIKNQILTFDEALIKAKKLGIKKIKKTLSDGEYIIREKYLKSKVDGKTIEVEMFVSVYEDITDYRNI